MRDYWSTIADGNKLYQMGPQSHRIYALNLLAGNIKAGTEFLKVGSLLDVGCGTAPIYQLLEIDRKKGASADRLWDAIQIYKGVDPSPAMIESCRHNFPDGDFYIEYAERLHELNESWDALLYMHAFDYIYEYKLAIDEMYRVTRRYVVIILWQPLDYREGGTHRLNNSINGPEDVDWETARLQHFNWWQLKKEFEEVGFKILLKKTDEEINKEGRHNTLIVLEK